MTGPSAAPAALTSPHMVDGLVDRLAVTDVLTRYSTCIDEFDYAGVRSALADDIWAQYGNADPVQGADALVEWISSATSSIVWQHHQLSLHRFELDGDVAKTVSYLTSHQVFGEEPDTAKIIVARYHDELSRTPEGWKIARRIMEVLWAESKPADGYIDLLGGRGPSVWQRG